MKVLVSILNYKGWPDTMNCLASLAQQTYTDFDILLINNGDEDGLAAKYKPKLKKNKNLTFVQNPQNTGVAPGFSQGCRYAVDHNYDAVILLNNDTTQDKDWLKYLVGAMKKKKVDAVSGLMLSDDGQTIVETGDFYSTWGVPMMRDENKPVDQASKSGFIFGGSGGAVMFSTNMLRQIGYFDDKFFAYNEDVDIAFRAQLAGYKCYYEKRAVVYHAVNASSGKIPGFTIQHTFQNLPLVYLKNVPRGMLWSVGWRFFLAYWMFFGYKTLQGGFVPAIKGVFKSLSLYPHALRERRRIQKSKVISNKELRAMFYRGLPMRQVQRLKKFFHLVK